MTFIVSIPSVTDAEDNVLNVYNWDDYIDDATIPEFEEKFGVKVHYDVYDSNETLLAKLQAGATGFDVIFPSDYMVEIMIQLELLENPLILQQDSKSQEYRSSFSGSIL